METRWWRSSMRSWTLSPPFTGCMPRTFAANPDQRCGSSDFTPTYPSELTFTRPSPPSGVRWPVLSCGTLFHENGGSPYGLPAPGERERRRPRRRLRREGLRVAALAIARVGRELGRVRTRRRRLLGERRRRGGVVAGAEPGPHVLLDPSELERARLGGLAAEGPGREPGDQAGALDVHLGGADRDRAG